MALEIMDGRLLLEKPLHTQFKNVDNADNVPRPPPPTQHPVTYDYLHDVESLYWVHLWILCRIPHSPLPTLENDIFRNVGDASASRRKLFLDGNFPTFHEHVEHLVESLENSRAALVTGYRSSLQGSRTDTTYAQAYGAVYLLFHLSSKVRTLELLPVQRLGYLTVPPSAPQRRSHDEDYVPPTGDAPQVEKMQLGKRSEPGGLFSCVEVPMKKRRSGARSLM